MLPSYRNQSVDLPCKSTDWFLYDQLTGFYMMETLAIKGLKGNYKGNLFCKKHLNLEMEAKLVQFSHKLGKRVSVVE